MVCARRGRLTLGPSIAKQEDASTKEAGLLARRQESGIAEKMGGPCEPPTFNRGFFSAHRVPDRLDELQAILRAAISEIPFSTVSSEGAKSTSAISEMPKLLERTVPNPFSIAKRFAISRFVNVLSAPRRLLEGISVTPLAEIESLGGRGRDSDHLLSSGSIRNSRSFVYFCHVIAEAVQMGENEPKCGKLCSPIRQKQDVSPEAAGDGLAVLSCLDVFAGKI
jgi:hypothetical protein